jgi:hypothetical protein
MRAMAGVQAMQERGGMWDSLYLHSATVSANLEFEIVRTHFMSYEKADFECLDSTFKTK